MKGIRLFLCLIPLPDQIFLLLGRQVPPAKLVFAYPRNCFVAVGKRHLVDRIGQLRVLLDDLIAVVAVQDRAVPDDEGRKDRPIR